MTDADNNRSTDANNDSREPLLEADLSYDVIGCLMQVRKDYGLGHKEKIYQEALEEEFKEKNINYEREKSISVKSIKTNKSIGFYRPDFVIDNKIILEIEVFPGSYTQEHTKRIYNYLKITKYEIAILVNFGTSRMNFKRIVWSNDRK